MGTPDTNEQHLTEKMKKLNVGIEVAAHGAAAVKK